MNKHILYAECRVTMIAGTTYFRQTQSFIILLNTTYFGDHPQVFQYESLKNKLKTSLKRLY